LFCLRVLVLVFFITSSVYPTRGAPANTHVIYKPPRVPCDILILTNAQHRISDWSNFDPDWQSKVVA
jgi:hypothetical protein